MDFSIPKEISEYLNTLDDFIEKKIKPLENEDDNIRFFDHRREHSRTNWNFGVFVQEDSVCRTDFSLVCLEVA